MLRNLKKNTYIYALIGLLLLTFFSSINVYPQDDNAISEKVKENKPFPKFNYMLQVPLNVGISTGPNVLDPVDSWDYPSWNVIDQVCEGLFTVNLSDPKLARINLLAETYWWEDDVTLRIKLREGISFHDYTPFDSFAAKWNLDRINYLTNASGALPMYEKMALPASLWKFSNGTGIMKQIDTVGPYNITIHLNGAFSPFLDLLSFSGAQMVSPYSHSQTDFIELGIDGLIGTGPFQYDYYFTDWKVHFTAFDSYWRGKANITEMVYTIISDPTALNNALLSGDVDFIEPTMPSYYSIFKTDPDITFAEAPTPGLVYQYLAFNNEKVNVTWRKAMSYAINYSYIIDELREDQALRAYGCISPGNGQYFNHWLRDAPGPADNGSAVYDLTVARQAILDGLSGDSRITGLTANSDPDDPAWEAVDLATFNYSYNVDNQFRSDLYVALSDWFDNIGITLIDGGTNWIWFIYHVYGFVPNAYDDLELFFIGWGPDYLDPFIMIDPLFSNVSVSNAAQVNDALVQQWLSDALKETNENIKQQIYWNIQWRLFADLYVHAPIYHTREYFTHSVNLTKFPYNAMGKFYFYPCEWAEFIEIQEALKIYIDDSDPNYNWSKTALENDWCSGSGKWNDPYIIENLIIDGENSGTCIEIHNSDVFFEIKNCTLYNGDQYLINLINTNNGKIYNNSMYNVLMSGIWAASSDNLTIYDNRIWDVTNGFGIYLITDSDHCKVINNTIESCIGGIATVYNSDNSIINNTLRYNQMGIGVAANKTIVEHNDLINNFMAGIMLQEANNTIINDNYLNTQNYGIWLFSMFLGSHKNTITNNRIYNSMQIGLAMDNISSQNTVYLNEFIGNGLNAEDNGTLNMWDNGIIGNSWDDYVGTDTDDDGIGDTPYLISGTAGSVDHYPIYDDGPDIVPTITINTPSDGDGFADIAPTFDLTVTDYDTIWYTLDGGITNTTCGTSGQIDPTLWGSLADDIYTLRFYANSSSGAIKSDAISIYKDTTDPVITIYDPDPLDEYLVAIPLYDIDITELHLSSAWYTLNDGTPIPLLSYTGTIDETAWNALAYEEINITFYAMDDLGNIGSSSVIVYNLDPTPASITINSPNNNQGFGDTAPMFDLTVTGYDSIWYTLDGGITNITCGTSGQIDPTLWDGLADGTYTLRFYANTSTGIISYEDVSIYKDTTDPTITITEPDTGDEYTTTIPIFEITVSDLHIDSVWYTLDGGVTNITITAYLGTIDETAWNALPNGVVTITFYAMDEVGNIGSSSVNVYKSQPSAPPDIPGPYPLLVIIILLAGIIGLTWKQKQKLT